MELTEAKLRPSEEGSEEALKILHLLWRTGEVLSAEAISALSGIPSRSVAMALIGLLDRGRVEQGLGKIGWRIARQLPIKSEYRRKI